MDASPPLVSDLGERALVKIIAERIGAGPTEELWSGDDAAVVSSGSRSMVSTDMLVEGLDFTTATFSPADIGWKAMCVNASDIAAMGARPTHAVAALGLPPSTSVDRFEGILDGLLEAAATYGISLVGGDLSACPQLVLVVTIMGRASEPAIARSGARPGDAVCVTGSLGGAAGGLVILQQGLDPVRSEAATRLVARQRRPRPRVVAGTALGDTGGVTAMIDVSDGLAVDLENLAAASDVGVRIDPKTIPIDPDLHALKDFVTDPPEVLDLAILGGEDFELLFTVGSGDLAAVAEALEVQGVAMSRIGSVVEDDSRIGDRSLAAWKEDGWEHLRTR